MQSQFMDDIIFTTGTAGPAEDDGRADLTLVMIEIGIAVITTILIICLLVFCIVAASG